MSDMIERVARAIFIADINETAALRPNASVKRITDLAMEAERSGSYQRLARAAIQAMEAKE